VAAAVTEEEREKSFVLFRKHGSGSLGSAHNGDGVNFVDSAARGSPRRTFSAGFDWR